MADAEQTRGKAQAQAAHEHGDRAAQGVEDAVPQVDVGEAGDLAGPVDHQVADQEGRPPAAGRDKDPLVERSWQPVAARAAGDQVQDRRNGHEQRHMSQAEGVEARPGDAQEVDPVPGKEHARDHGRRAADREPGRVRQRAVELRWLEPGHPSASSGWRPR